MALKKIDAGELKRTVILRQPVSVRNSEGGKETSYADAITCRAKIEKTNLRSDEGRRDEAAPVLLNTDNIWIRYAGDRSALTKDWLVKYDGVDRIIHSIEMDSEIGFIKLIVRSKDG